jgi:hypothetical protein
MSSKTSHTAANGRIFPTVFNPALKFCPHPLPRGQYNRLLTNPMMIMRCKACGASVTAHDLENRVLYDGDLFMFPAKLPALEAGEEGLESAPLQRKQHPGRAMHIGQPARIGATWFLRIPTPEEFAAWREMAKSEREEYHVIRDMREIADAPTWGPSSAVVAGFVPPLGGRASREDREPRQASVSLTMWYDAPIEKLRERLELWEITPRPFDDAKASYTPIEPPTRPIRKATRAAQRRALKKATRPIITVSKSAAAEIDMRRYRACGDEVCALRLEGKSVTEIADATGIAMRTIERRLADAGITVRRTVQNLPAMALNGCESEVSV